MHSIGRTVCLLALLVSAIFTLVTQPARASVPSIVCTDMLPRRGLLGASLIDQHGSVIIKSIVPASPAESGGLRPGDNIEAIDGEPVASVAEFLRKLKRPAGQPVDLTIGRDHQSVHKTIVLAEAPKERDPQVVTDYESVTVDGTLRRVLITVPRGSDVKRPAVLFIGGIGCYSIDLPLSLGDPYALLAHDLSKGGFITMRLEKSGVGDSQGSPCSTVDFTTEAHSYAIALQALRANPLVDPKRVYLFGHSIGTVIAPRLAAAQTVAGIVVAEAVARNWFEYELANVQRQLELSGDSPKDVDNLVAGKELCMHRLLIEQQQRSAILHDRPDCAEAMQYPVPDAYMQEVAGLNLAEAWTKVTVPVLVVYGRADFETDEADHKRIADIVNSLHPGNATYKIIDDMDHLLTVARSQQASYEADTHGKSLPYNTIFSQTVLSWLSQRASSSRNGL